ncbi:hypothetical protein BCR42DRAFT_433207 [Absidia repens]|uniref:Yeast cell wall synthesis Kre9/Knh1-like N-terminal domain-containing protein n=1 Tax=Absidia repens TaxID=90262 RepID=A0A1X2IWV9_9FUNG|nr:hypothetical protein BCR42DRAFT_433207 [Absidia repens]
MSPSYPEPGSVWTAGKEYEITWEEDNTEPTINATWKNFRIDLMSGEDLDQQKLTTIAENVKGNALKHKYTAPEVAPHAPIYFLMFTSDNGEYAWSSRFAIVGQDGKQEVPENSAQPSGEKIPWGVGKLVSGDDAAAMASSPSASADAGKSNPSASPSASAASMASKPASASQSNARSASASPSSPATAHKGNAKPEEKKLTADATIQSVGSFTMVGALVSSIVALFLL